MSQTSSLTTDFVLGEYVTDSPGGLRTYPYSVNPTTNPLTYQSLRTLNEIHGWPIVSRHTGYADVLTEAIGEVWANMLHTVYAVLVEEHGFSTRKLTDVDGSEGNIVFMHLFIDALSLQPCNPSCEPRFSDGLIVCLFDTHAPQSCRHAMHGFRRTKTDTTAPIGVPYSRLSPVVA